MNIRIFSYIQVPCDRPPHQIKKYLHIVKLQVFWEKRAWSSFLLKLMTFPGHLIVSACQFLHQRTSLLFSIFVSYTIPKTTESKNKLPLYFTHFCISLRYDISYKKKIFSKVGVKEKLSNHLNWMELLMIIFAEYTSVSWELGEDKLDLLIDNSTRPLLYFQHGIFVDFKHDCISRQFSVLQCYPHLRFFRCAVALVWISSFILALPVIWTNVSFCHLKMRNI